MDYTPIERDVLSAMQRTDFKNLSKSDVISFASKLAELRPEVAKEVLAQYPEYIGLMKAALTEYKDILSSIVNSDDASIQEYYEIANRGLDTASNSRVQFDEIIKLALADCSKLLDNPNLSPEKMVEILNREVELVKMAKEKDTEIRQEEIRIENNVNKKDSEKRAFNWKLVGSICATLVIVAGASASVLGGNFDLKLPDKK